jgi:sec-independent protein translocase protein TatA
MLESPIQIALLFGAALIVFGPKKLPELGKALGQGLGNFKRSLQEAQEEVKNAAKVDQPANADGANLTPPAAGAQANAAAPGAAAEASSNPKSSSG